MAAVRRMPPGVRRGMRAAGALVVVAATAIAVGTGPFLRGLAAVSPATILAAVVLCALATAAAAWRWRIVAASLGVPLPWRDAFTAYYRSQFLNTVLPGGVLGDVHRAYDEGRRREQLGLAARAVAAERIAGQVVQLLVTLAILLPLGLAAQQATAVWIIAAAALVLAAAAGACALTRRGRRIVRRELGLLRPLLARPRTLVAIAAASVVVVAAHVTMFVVAARAVGIPAAPGRLVVSALIVLGAAAIPLSIGGWGPREAAGASVFAIAGLGAGAGVAASTAFGVLTMLALAPGAVALVAARARTRRQDVPAGRSSA